MSRGRKRATATKSQTELSVLAMLAAVLEGDETAKLMLADRLADAGHPEAGNRLRERRSLYVCNHVWKTTQRDDFEGGCDPDSCVNVLDERVRSLIMADSLKGLVEAIGERFGLSMDDLFIPGDEDTVTSIGFNRNEKENGEPPDEADQDEWKQGELDVYLADYHFRIEKRVIEPIFEGDFKKAGIKTH